MSSIHFQCHCWFISKSLQVSFSWWVDSLTPLIAPTPNPFSLTFSVASGACSTGTATLARGQTKSSFCCRQGNRAGETCSFHSVFSRLLVHVGRGYRLSLVLISMSSVSCMLLHPPFVFGSQAPSYLVKSCFNVLLSRRTHSQRPTPMSRHVWQIGNVQTLTARVVGSNLKSLSTIGLAAWWWHVKDWEHQ